MQNAHTAVQQAATQMGAALTSQELDALSRRYIYEGWSDPKRSQLMATALSGEITFMPDERGNTSLMGESGNLQDDLRSVATANGLTYSDNWYESAAKSVAAGLKTANDWERDVREQAAHVGQRAAVRGDAADGVGSGGRDAWLVRVPYIPQHPAGGAGEVNV
jgi:hypothetical protein